MAGSVQLGAHQQLLELRKALAAQRIERLQHAPAHSAQLLHLALPQSELPLREASVTVSPSPQHSFLSLLQAVRKGPGLSNLSTNTA